MESLKKLLFLVALLIAATSCIREETQTALVKPKQFIKRKDLVSLLVDLHVGQATLQQARGLHGDADSLRDHLYQSIFTKYDTNKDAFDSTISYLEHDPKQLSQCYEEAMVIISQRQAEISRSEDS